MPDITTVDSSQSDFADGVLSDVEALSSDVLALAKSASCVDIDASAYCSFTGGEGPQGQGHITGLDVTNQAAESLLSLNNIDSGTDGYIDLTSNIVEAPPGDVLTFAITVLAGAPYALSWGHDINNPGTLEKAADLIIDDGGGDWEYTYNLDWTVPSSPGNYLVSFWIHYSSYDAGCGTFTYAERVDISLCITSYVTSGYRISPQVDLSTVQRVNGSQINWSANLNGQTITIESRVSTDNGSTWTAWAACTNGAAIPDLTPGDDVTSGLLECRQSLSTADSGTTPELDSLTIVITTAAYSASLMAIVDSMGNAGFIAGVSTIVPPISTIAIEGNNASLNLRQTIVAPLYRQVDSRGGAAAATISSDLMQIGLIPKRPRHYWTPDPVRTQALYLFSLDGQIIPISSCQIRRRNGEPTYMSVVIPDYDTWVDTITAQSGGEMILYKGYRFSDGSIQSQEITRVDYETARFDKGSRQLSISLTGHATTTNDEPNTVTIQGASYRSVGNDGLRRFRAAVDLWLQPGDTAVIENESIVVGFISYIIDVKQGTMEIVEAEE